MKHTPIYHVVALSGAYASKVFLPSMQAIAQIIGLQTQLQTVAQVGTAWMENRLFALASLPWYAYARQGAPQVYPNIAAQAIAQAVRVTDWDPTLLPQKVWTEFQDLCQRSSVGPNRKLPAVRDLVRWCVNLKAPGNTSPIAYLRQQMAGNVAALHAEVKSEVRGMGDKTTAFLLRDIAWVYGVGNTGSLAQAQNQVYLQPIDIWVRRVAECLWPDRIHVTFTWKDIASVIVQECNKAGVSPIQFNQGAWYFGARVVGRTGDLCQGLRQLIGGGSKAGSCHGGGGCGG